MTSPSKSKREYRYAEGTEVSVSRSREELERILRARGAGQILSGSDTDEERGFIAFTLDKRQYRIDVRYAGKPGVKAAASTEQREKEGWRVLVLMVKAKLEVVRMGHSTVEQEFLANVVLPDGSVVADHVLPGLKRAYDSGAMPKLLPAWSGSIAEGELEG